MIFYSASVKFQVLLKSSYTLLNTRGSMKFKVVDLFIFSMKLGKIVVKDHIRIVFHFLHKFERRLIVKYHLYGIIFGRR